MEEKISCSLQPRVLLGDVLCMEIELLEEMPVIPICCPHQQLLSQISCVLIKFLMWLLLWQSKHKLVIALGGCSGHFVISNYEGIDWQMTECSSV